MSREKLITRLTFDIRQIDSLMRTYSGLLARARAQEPDHVEKAALCAVVQSFYHGVESICLAVAKAIDGSVPSGPEWHRQLLAQMSHDTPDRGRIVTSEAHAALTRYLSFRHFARHSYASMLQWQKLKELVEPLPQVWEDLQAQLLGFVDHLRAREAEDPSW